MVRLEGNAYTQSTTTDADGVYRFQTVYEDDYTVTAGRWGWNTACPANILVAGSDQLGQMIELEQGFADDFALDLGWQVSSTASRGAWERGTPQGTMQNNTPSNPGVDVQGDCRGQAYVTGNGGGQAGADDVDEGATVLTSPLFDGTGMIDPHIRFHHWFFNAGGNSAPNDELTFSLSNGSETVVIRTVDAGSDQMSAWRFNSIRIADHLVPTSTMRFIASTADDQENGHILEAGLDRFAVVPEATTSVSELDGSIGLRLWPNPSRNAVTIETGTNEEALIEVMDAVGRIVVAGVRTSGGRLTLQHDLPSGTYVVRATTAKGEVLMLRAVVGR